MVFFSNKKQYREALISDIQIRKKLMTKFSFAGIIQVDIERAIKKLTVIIYSAKPGMIIGRGGKGLEELKNYLLVEMKISPKKNKEMKIDLKIEPLKKNHF